MTAVVYTLLGNKQYDEVIRILGAELQNFPESRAALPLTAYAHFASEGYGPAAAYYERLVKLHPEVEEYKLAHAQCLYKVGSFDDAGRAVLAVENKEYAREVAKLQACIKYDEDDLASTRALIESAPVEDVEATINRGCLDYKEGKYEAARVKFSAALDAGGFKGVVAYSV